MVHSGLAMKFDRRMPSSHCLRVVILRPLIRVKQKEKMLRRVEKGEEGEGKEEDDIDELFLLCRGSSTVL